MMMLLLGNAIGVLPPLWIPLISVNALIWLVSARRVATQLEGLELRADVLAGYEALFALARSLRTTSPLADLPARWERSDAVHSREHYERREGSPRMAFDYMLREGVATTTNAPALLEMMGVNAPT